MLSGFHKHNTQTFSQYFSPSQSWEILGISLVIHLLWHGSPIPKRKNIRKEFIFFSTSLIWRIYIACLPPYQALVTFPDLMLSYCHTHQLGKAILMVFTGSHHVTDWVWSHWGCWQTSIKWKGHHQPIAKITVALNSWKFLIMNHMHPLKQTVVQCLAALSWTKLVKLRSSNNGKKTTQQKIKSCSWELATPCSVLENYLGDR